MFNFTDIGFMVGVVVGISQLLKKTGFPIKIIPIANLVFGIISGFIYVAPSQPKTAILAGIIIGLSASGLYSGTKNTIENLK